MLPERPDYGDWSDEDLSDELAQLDQDIEYWRKSMAGARKLMNQAMESREDILDLIKQRGQVRGWQRKRV